MKASYEWLKELSGVDAAPAEVAARLTGAGIEVEAIERKADGLDRVVVAEVRSRRPHPERDRLTLVTVFDGEGEQEVVCGAPNVPDPGGRVLLARVGARLPGGLEVAERKIAGVVSRGMIASEAELGIGPDESGILVLGAADGAGVAPGSDAAQGLGLRDAIFELSLTPNRPDCLGHVGLAREVAVLFGVPFAPPAGEPIPSGPGSVDFEGHGPVSIDIPDPDRCPRYGASFVRGVTVGPSPLATRVRLHNLGMRPLSNVVDVTNVTMLEWGHPIHGFDLSLLRGRRIVVRRARKGEKMRTLDGVERTFTDDDLLICDAEGPVAIAGVMGGENSEIKDSTRDVLIECAYFDPRSVRRTARRVGLHTDASHRFERGVDPGAVPAVMAAAAHRMQALCGGQVLPRAIDAHPHPVARRTLVLRKAKLDSLLGVEVPWDRARTILAGLGCEVADTGDSHGPALRADAPTHRPDLAREEDLVEEVARIHGYDAIPTRVPRVVPSTEGTPPLERFVRRARELAAAAGLDEAVTYAFVSPRELEVVGSRPEATVALSNPLSEERSVMRTSLLPGLAAAAGRAQRHQVDSVALFELASTFHPAGAVLPREVPRLALFLVGPRGAEDAIGPGEPFDFYDGKGILDAIVGPLTGSAPETVLGDRLGHLHPARQARVRVAGADAGALGELHPDTAVALGVAGRPVFAELDVAALFAAAGRVGVPQARALPRYPSVTRDVALLLDDGVPAGEVADSIRQQSKLIESVALFDLFRGDQLPKGKKSLAFRIVYRDPDATLTDAAVDALHATTTAGLTKRFDAVLR